MPSLDIQSILGDPPNAESGPQIISWSVAESQNNRLIADVTVELSEPATVYVEYGNPDVGLLKTNPTRLSSANGTVHVVRLRSETDYAYRITALNSNDAPSATEDGVFTTPPLPAELADLKFRTEGSASFDLVLMDVNDSDVTGTAKGQIVAVDDQGEIVWYHLAGDKNVRAIKQSDDYSLVFLDGEVGIREVDVFGSEIHKLVDSERTGNSHHDFLLDDDGTVIFISNIRQELQEDFDLIEAGTDIITLAIRRWDPVMDDVVILWDMFDHLSLDEHLRDLNEAVQLTELATHPNSLWTTETGSTLVSFRHLNQIISIAPGFGEIEWRLGGPLSDFEFPDPNDQFYHQHQAIELTGNRILLFDNGNDRPEEEGGQFSRAMILDLDFETMTAVKTWEYRNDPDIYSRSISGVDVLENGNILVNFGRTTDMINTPVTAVEADLSGNPVWRIELEAPPIRTRYRAYVLDSLYGESRLTDGQ